jgi:ribose transport system permease protein
MNAPETVPIQEKTRHPLLGIFQNTTGIIAFIVLFAIAAAVTSGRFARPSNLVEVLMRAAVIGIVALGQNLVIFTGGADLSVGAVFGLNVGILSYFAKHNLDPGVGILVGLAATTLCGFINGLLVSRTKMPPFVVTLGMMMIAQSVGLTVVGAGAEDLPGHVAFVHRLVGNDPTLGTILPLLVWIVVLGVAALFITFSKFGPNIFAIGGKELAAIYSGVNVRRVKLLVYTISGFTAGIGSTMLSYRIGGSNPLAGSPYMLLSIAAVVMGGTSIYGGEGSVYNTIIGAITLSILVNVMNIVQINPFIQDIVMGVVLLLFVFILTKMKQVSERA